MALTEKNINVEDNVAEMASDNVVTQEIAEKKEEVVNTTSKEETQVFDGDINLSATRKKRFRIDGDNNRYLELDTSDMGIITRLDNLYPKLQKLAQDAAIKQLDKEEAAGEKALSKISNALIKIDAQMRQIVDDIFQSDVSAKCAPSGTMFDPFNGEFRYEHIIDVVGSLYKENIKKEFKKMANNMSKRTAKYTKGK